jgi:hypothetical protein
VVLVATVLLRPTQQPPARPAVQLAGLLSLAALVETHRAVQQVMEMETQHGLCQVQAVAVVAETQPQTRPLALAAMAVLEVVAVVAVAELLTEQAHLEREETVDLALLSCTLSFNI